MNHFRLLLMTAALTMNLAALPMADADHCGDETVTVLGVLYLYETSYGDYELYLESNRIAGLQQGGLSHSPYPLPGAVGDQVPLFGPSVCSHPSPDLRVA